MPTKQTGFGLVDREALERLREEYDTMQILHAVDRIDQATKALLDLREQLMALHGMATQVLRDNIVPGRESDVEDIHELVEIVDSGGFDLIEAGEAIQSCCEPLRALDSEECLAEREGWAD
ncbi:MAG: hypothetical protein F4103_17350 [Boseongicola sp. SB0673_bin_14]|nr:hypothetical protein [Boseongicola sp. SB0673_bin_14]